MSEHRLAWIRVFRAYHLITDWPPVGSWLRITSTGDHRSPIRPYLTFPHVRAREGYIPTRTLWNTRAGMRGFKKTVIGAHPYFVRTWRGLA